MPMGSASRRAPAPVAWLVLLVLTAAAPGPTNPAMAIAAAANHPSLRHLRAEVLESRDGQTQTVTLERAGTRWLERTCSQGLCSGQWFDGTNRSTFGINGTVLPETASPAVEERERTATAIVSTAFAEPAFTADGGTVQPLPAGPASLRFAVAARGGATLVAVADARTHRLTGIELPDGAAPRQLSATRGAGLTFFGDRAYDRLEASDDPLRPPAGPAWSFAEPYVLPLLSAQLPIVPCTLGGRKARCLLDTGTTPSAVTLEFAEALGREPHGRIEIGGLTTYLTGVIDPGPLALGGCLASGVEFAVIPRAPQPTFDVIVGSDVLAGIRLSLEPALGRALIGPTQPGAGRSGVPLTFSAGLPRVLARLGTRVAQEPMLLDTGDMDSVSIGYDEYRGDPDLFSVREHTKVSGAGAGSLDALAGTLAQLAVGELAFGAVEISAVRGQHIGHIGYGLAARCRPLVVDFPERSIFCATAHVSDKAAAGNLRM